MLCLWQTSWILVLFLRSFSSSSHSSFDSYSFLLFLQCLSVFLCFLPLLSGLRSNPPTSRHLSLLPVHLTIPSHFPFSYSITSLFFLSIFSIYSHPRLFFLIYLFSLLTFSLTGLLLNLAYMVFPPYTFFYSPILCRIPAAYFSLILSRHTATYSLFTPYRRPTFHLAASPPPSF